MAKRIGILTSGGDCPGLNAAIRGIGKPACDLFNMQVLGFRDGFRGLVENNFVKLNSPQLSGILTQGGTILGTSRDKPHRMLVGGKLRDMTQRIINVYHQHKLHALVCLGGNGTQKNARRLMDQGLNILTLPKTIDNDVAATDVSFGFDTALAIATDAIDRLHSTATSHNRIIVVEMMGHHAGWLALGAGIAGGADVILIPEIPYDLKKVAAAIRHRTQQGKRFSIVAVAEGAITMDEAKATRLRAVTKSPRNTPTKSKSKPAAKSASAANHDDPHLAHYSKTLHLTEQLEKLTGTEARLTVLGHLQRGGTPSAADRLLATRLGTACAELLNQNVFGVMVAARGQTAVPVALQKVAGETKLVPRDHPWIQSARCVGTCFGD
jgi:6-phosphofructokinase 1